MDNPKKDIECDFSNSAELKDKGLYFDDNANLNDKVVSKQAIMIKLRSESVDVETNSLVKITDWNGKIDNAYKYSELVMNLAPMDVPVTDIDPIQGEFTIAQGKGARKKKTVDKINVLQIGASNVKAMENIRNATGTIKKVGDKSKQLMRNDSMGLLV
jgi:hypothetical protein